jgi:uncharacterized membrane-anchored protein YhcB (DUF1043 family)
MKKVTDRLLERLHLVRWSDYKAIRDMAKNDSKLCADLVGECNSQSKIIDELSDENARLKEQLAKASEDLASNEESYDSLRNRLLHASETLALIHSMTDEV